MIGDDPWPHVRATVATVASQLPPDNALPILGRAIGDKAAQVRLAALKSAIRIGDPRADQIIETRLRAPDEKSQIKAKAAWGAGKRCQRSALPLLFELLTQGAEPLADFDQISVGVTAARAMGDIGGEEAKALLEKASRRSNPATDRAIEAALKTLGQQCR
jgi:HEAT repeat protein